MSGLSINWLNDLSTYLPWISFIAGFGGSLHCVGMCGGLVTATCDRSSDVFRYQTGRLLGYLLLGALAGFLGQYLSFKNQPPFFSVIPALFIGIIFIYWGVQNLRGKRAEFPAPKIVSKFYQRLWFRLVHKNENFTKAFFTGLISIFLPCGLLYGVVLGTISLQHRYEALFSMFFFWLGTMPSMVVAPVMVQKLIRPLKARLPKTFAISLVAIGIMTITFRMVKVYDGRDTQRTVKHEHKNNCH